MTTTREEFLARREARRIAIDAAADRVTAALGIDPEDVAITSEGVILTPEQIDTLLALRSAR